MTIKMALPQVLVSLSDTDQGLCEGFISTNEGFRSYPYDDATGLRVKAPKGNLTVGYGTNLANGLSPLEALTLLRGRLCAAESVVIDSFPAYGGLSSVRKIVILDMAYNMNANKLISTFDTFLGLVKAGNYIGAAEDGTRTLWYKQVGLRGVKNMYMMKNNDWMTT